VTFLWHYAARTLTAGATTDLAVQSGLAAVARSSRPSTCLPKTRRRPSQRLTNTILLSAVYEGMNGQPIASALPIAALSSPAERLAALFDAHHDRLYRLARRLSSSADDALDLVQETFLRAARSPMSVPSGFGREEAWLVRVLINIRRDEWRKMAVRTRFHREMCDFATVDTNQEASLIARATVWRALDTLAPRRRAVVVMHELEGLTASAIASILGISAITVRWHLSMAHRDLTRALTLQMGASDEDH
jgi:RNA polymerase sigma factor (sigma-70 family)